jgi:hexosaminidase
LSKGWYLDHYFTASQYYLVDPVPDSGLTLQQKKLIIGGEACMWSEYVSPENIDSRIWPRAAAIAERLWSPRDIRNVRDMYRRLDAVSLELDRLGLTQLKNQGTMLRNLANGYRVAPLRTLVDIVAPYDIYARVKAKPYSAFAPLTRVVDTAVPDPMTARDFSFMVDDIVSGNNPMEDTVAMVEHMLVRWKENDANLEKIIDRSPILREVQPISRHLSAVASIGLDALNYIRHNTKAGQGWVKASLSTISTDAAPCAEVKLMVIAPIESLVKYAGEK